MSHDTNIGANYEIYDKSRIFLILTVKINRHWKMV